MQLNRQNYRLFDTGTIGRILLAIGLLGLAAGITGGVLQDSARFFRSWVVAYAFWLSLGLGALFLIMQHYLTGSVWSVVLRRLAENLAMVLPGMIVLFIPVFFGSSHLFPWTHPELYISDRVLQQKSFYLNTGFFTVRWLLYFIAWAALAITLYRFSLRQDRDPAGSRIQTARRLSAGGMVIYAFTITFAAIDWLMSSDPQWYSTIFAVAFFCGSATAALSLITLIAIYLHRQGILSAEITVEHYYDLGKLTFAFVIMWTYMAFSQYLLIWYANIPEEVVWYRQRSGPWLPASILVAFGQFAVPFLVLMSKSAKRNLKVLTIISLWLLAMHWVNLYWYVLPNLGSGRIFISWVDVALTVGIGGLFMWIFWRWLTRHPVVPVGDPDLKASISFSADY